MTDAVDDASMANQDVTRRIGRLVEAQKVTNSFSHNLLAAAVQIGGAGPLRVMDYYIYNPGAAAAYVQFFDILAAPTVGTTVPVRSLGIPDGAGANLGNLNWYFANGLWIAATTLATNLTAPGSGLEVNIGWR